MHVWLFVCVCMHLHGDVLNVVIETTVKLEENQYRVVSGVRQSAYMTMIWWSRWHLLSHCACTYHSDGHPL